MDNIVKLQRIATSKNTTVGLLSIGDFSCVTLERSWKNNERNVSCIPAGTYDLKKDKYYGGKKPYDNYTLLNVPGRTHVDIHIGNYYYDSLACILPATTIHLDQKNQDFVVWNSRKAFNKLMLALEDKNNLKIQIIDIA